MDLQVLPVHKVQSVQLAPKVLKVPLAPEVDSIAGTSTAMATKILLKTPTTMAFGMPSIAKALMELPEHLALLAHKVQSD